MRRAVSLLVTTLALITFTTALLSGIGPAVVSDIQGESAPLHNLVSSSLKELIIPW